MKKLRQPKAECRYADVYALKKFVAFQALSGCGLVRPEDGALPNFIAADADPRIFGQALLEAYNQSRFISPSHPELQDFCDMTKHSHNHKIGEAEIMRRAGGRSKREAFRNAVACTTQQIDGRIHMVPFAPYNSSTGWRPLPDEKTVVIAVTDDPNVLGAALLEALKNGAWTPETGA